MVLPMDDTQFRQLLESLGLSWKGYRKVRKGVKKRVARHMRRLGCASLREYLRWLEQREAVRRECDRLMGVCISRFFRDLRLWEILENQILPQLLDTHEKRTIHQDRINVWSAGCACGEEVYSLKILWERLGRSCLHSPMLGVTATDLNPLSLKRAKDAYYPQSSLKEVPENLKATCFQAEPGKKGFRVNPALKGGIKWLEHDFFSGPPGPSFHLIFIRNNLLTYYQDERVEPALQKITDALSPCGYMIIGSHEDLPFQVSGLKPHPSLSYAFRKEG